MRVVWCVVRGWEKGADSNLRRTAPVVFSEEPRGTKANHRSTAAPSGSTDSGTKHMPKNCQQQQQHRAEKRASKKRSNNSSTDRENGVKEERQKGREWFSPQQRSDDSRITARKKNNIKRGGTNTISVK